MLRFIVNEDADSRYGRVQFPAKVCCQLIRNAAFRTGKDEACIVGVEFIGPGDVAGRLRPQNFTLTTSSGG